MGKEMSWYGIKKRAQEASRPSSTSKFAPGGRLLGYGWEWAVYEIYDSSEVVKVPRGIFPEVNSEEYLDVNKRSYEICVQYLDRFVADSRFVRDKETNLIYQERLLETPKIVDDQTSDDLRIQYKEISLIVLEMLGKLRWIPDFNLKRVASNSWSVSNLMVSKENNLKLVDFAAYFDVFRLGKIYRTWHVYEKRRTWKKFIKELEV